MTYSKELEKATRGMCDWWRKFLKDVPPKNIIEVEANNITFLLDEIDRLTAAKKWVSVSEKNPPDSADKNNIDEYNVCDRKGNVYSAYWNNGTWIDQDGARPGLFDITHWQPLPTPTIGGEI